MRQTNKWTVVIVSTGLLLANVFECHASVINKNLENENVYCRWYASNGDSFDPYCIEYPQDPVATIQSPSASLYNLIDSEQTKLKVIGSAMRSVDGSMQNYSIEYASRQEPDKWLRDRVKLTDKGLRSIYNGNLGEINIEGLTDNTYFVRLTVRSLSGGVSRVTSAFVIDRAIMSGWPKATDVHFYASPAVADIDPKAKGLEIVAVSNKGEIYVWHADGSLVGGWPKTVGTAVTTPAIADLDGDGYLEIVISCFHGMVHAYHHDGTNVQGWPQTTSGVREWSTTALSDMDADGDLEVVMGSDTGKVYAWHHDGVLVSGWPIRVTAQIQASPAIGDLDGDGFPEVVINAKDGNVYVLNGDGSFAKGWPQKPTMTTRSTASAALGDLDGDGDLEIVVGMEYDGNYEDFRIFVWHHDGVMVDGWPQEASWLAVRPASAQLADMDNDGEPEIIMMSGDNRVSIWSSDGTPISGWPPADIGFDGFEYAPSSPSIADIDGDKNLEIIIEESGHKFEGLWLYDIHAVNLDASAVPGWPKTVSGFSNSSPTIADIDLDGDVEVLLGSDGLFIWDLPGEYSENSEGWPVYRYNNQRTGNYDAQ